jgi:methyltransferase (TIGR00027 family)
MNGNMNISSEHVSHTALNAAALRAMESKKPNALFKDYFAERFLIDQNVNSLLFNEDLARWTLVLRTYIIDRYIESLVKQGIDTILNLGAGLDTRPYRLNLNRDLKWYEADYDNIINLKNQKLIDVEPNCALQQVAIDLSDLQSRKDLLSRIGSGSKNVLVLCEGLLMYLSPETVNSLGQELFSICSIKSWMIDITNKPFIDWAKKYLLKSRDRISIGSGCSINFFPDNTAEFLHTLGWELEEFTSYAQCGIELNRIPNGFTYAELISEPGLQAIGVGLFHANRE